ncbi:hypothetical protein C6568_10760 [Melaminivora suipulveris]|uniref:BcpO-related WXXGXW repeat protein n=1 Tax=Melaminivora suipulveris TaxID=2109913 RepID=A0A2R3QH35_9BURK|nr:YXWGXW repeat-containing protein [Melaminivora suipulveris]AVO51079.1 hypothetical protein C6568_10760 [Melaminivora suipulveris]
MARIAPPAARWAALSFFLALAAGAVQAAPSATVVIQTGPRHAAQPVHVMPPPPPPRYERAPAPRRGMVWSQGHWEWRGQRYAWVPGQWMRVRHGQQWRQPLWRQHGGRWQFEHGRWDRDRDGVPNRYDRHPNNPRRY